MKTKSTGLAWGLLCLTAAVVLLTACSKYNETPTIDHPRLTPGVAMRDVVFHSAALARDMQYRVVSPTNMRAGQKLPVVYVLHGGGADFRQWSNDSDVAHYAELGMILVMPQGDSSYYTNSAERPQDRYEDYIVKDLILDVENRLPAALGRQNRAIVGVSMGGFGAVKLGLRHPDTFAFVGGISSVLDVPQRPFSIKRISQWRHHRSIFGPRGGQPQRDNDPLVLVRSAEPATAPYFFLTCGEQEGFIASNQQFAALLAHRNFQFEFHTGPGGHDWTQWNRWLPALFESLSAHLKRQS